MRDDGDRRHEKKTARLLYLLLPIFGLCRVLGVW